MNFLRLFFAFLLSLFASDLVAEKVLNKNFDKLKHYSRKPLLTLTAVNLCLEKSFNFL